VNFIAVHITRDPNKQKWLRVSKLQAQGSKFGRVTDDFLLEPS
jgi:hypothetical protein